MFFHSFLTLELRIMLAISITSFLPAALATSMSKRDVPAAGYYLPASNGGSMLTSPYVTYPAGLGEPLNVIVSAKSDSAVLSGEGMNNYFNSIGFGAECLGQHIGVPQRANLGDGNGLKNETAVIRWAFGDFTFGTCQETIQGGNHFRYWVQDGSQANSGALFFATSYEQNLTLGHDIVQNGYDFGRDLLVGNATSSANGTWTTAGWSFNTTVEYTEGLLSAGTENINHGISIDGRVAVLTVKVTHTPTATGSTPSTSGTTSASAPTWTFHFLPLMLPLGTFFLALSSL